MVLQDSRNFTRVHYAGQTRPLISVRAKCEHDQIQGSGYARLTDGSIALPLIRLSFGLNSALSINSSSGTLYQFFQGKGIACLGVMLVATWGLGTD